MRYKHYCLKSKKSISDIWKMPRPMGKYTGIYPQGFIERLTTLIPMKNKMILHQFGGTTTKDKFNHTVDINPEVNPTYLTDARTLDLIPDETYDIVLADPPYDSQDITYSKKLYNCEVVKPYSFVRAGINVLKPGGYYCILHQLVYLKPDDCRRYAVIAISTGPNMRLRTLNVFQKNVKLSDFE